MHGTRKKKFSSREEQIDDLLNYQKRELNDLIRELQDLDRKIETAEHEVLKFSNHVSAARGLVGMRTKTRSRSVEETTETELLSLPSCKTNSVMEFASHLSHATKDLSFSDSVSPVGIIYSKFCKRFEAPRQSFLGGTGTGVILFDTKRSPTIANTLVRIDPGGKLWLLYWLDRNSGEWRHFVRPPRAKGGYRVGTFSTRSPNRPTPIGLSLCNVDSICMEPPRIYVSGLDILDETPLVGFRSYSPGREAFSDLASGWLDDKNGIQPLYYDSLSKTERQLEMHVLVSDLAQKQLRYIEKENFTDIFQVVHDALAKARFLYAQENVSSGPFVREYPVGAFRIHHKVDFQENSVTVLNVASGMRSFVCDNEAASDPEARLHKQFKALFEASSD